MIDLPPCMAKYKRLTCTKIAALPETRSALHLHLHNQEVGPLEEPAHAARTRCACEHIVEEDIQHNELGATMKHGGWSQGEKLNTKGGAIGEGRANQNIA